MTTKPPSGIMPRFIWLEFLEVVPPSKVEIQQRAQALRSAIDRYRAAGATAPTEWFTELRMYRK